MNIEALTTELITALKCPSVDVAAAFPDAAARRVTKPVAAVGVRSIKTKPLCFGDGLAGVDARMRRAEIEFALDLYASDADGCLAALNNVASAALLRGLETDAGGALPEKCGDCYRLSAALKTSAVMTLEPSAEAEVIDLNFVGRITI